jgi:tetratricopeptide (TPR) repeat protein
MARSGYKLGTVSIFSLSSCFIFSACADAAESIGTAKVTVYPLVREGYDELQKGAYIEAVQSLCQAVILDRDDVSARRYLALALIKADNADRALEQMGLVGRLTPPSAFDYYIYGEAYLAVGKYKEAEEAYRKSLEKDPLSDTARAGVIKSLVDALEWDKAVAECQKYLKQAKTKEQKAYFQTMLKKVKEAKAGPPLDNEQAPPIVPAPTPSPSSAASPTAPALIPASQPSPPAPTATSTPLPQAQTPANTTTQTPPAPAQPASPKTLIVLPKTALPSLKASPTLP